MGTAVKSTEKDKSLKTESNMKIEPKKSTNVSKVTVTTDKNVKITPKYKEILPISAVKINKVEGRKETNAKKANQGGKNSTSNSHVNKTTASTKTKGELETYTFTFGSKNSQTTSSDKNNSSIKNINHQKSNENGKSDMTSDTYKNIQQ